MSECLVRYMCSYFLVLLIIMLQDTKDYEQAYKQILSQKKMTSNTTVSEIVTECCTHGSSVSAGQ